MVYYHSNTLYSIYALTDGSENVVERCRSAKPSYGSFAGGETPPMREGEPVVQDADLASEADTPPLKFRRASWSADADAASDAENPYLFTARRVDSETDLMQYRNRYYSVIAGRFISRDPTGYGPDYSLYLFIGGRPLYAVDPLGTVWITLAEDTTAVDQTLASFSGSADVGGGCVYWESESDEGCYEWRKATVEATWKGKINLEGVINWKVECDWLFTCRQLRIVISPSLNLIVKYDFALSMWFDSNTSKGRVPCHGHGGVEVAADPITMPERGGAELAMKLIGGEPAAVVGRAIERSRDFSTNYRAAKDAVDMMVKTWEQIKDISDIVDQLGG